MKKIFLLAMAIAIAQFTFAQFGIGPKAGFGVNWTDLDTTTDEISSGEAELALNVGAFVRFGGKKFYVQPEAIFSSTTSKVVFDDGMAGQQIAESKLGKIDVPLIFAAKPISFLSFQAGPVASIIVNEDDDIGDKIAGAVRDYEDFTLGFQAGAGLELGKMLIDLRYEGNISDVGSGRIGPFDFDERTPQVKATVGFNLF